MVAGFLKRATLAAAGVAFGMALVVGEGFWRARRTPAAAPPAAGAVDVAPAASTPARYPAPAVQG